MLHEAKIPANREAFKRKVKQIAQKLSIPPDWLMQVMNSESGLNHTAVNRHGGATGLIQFMPATAREMFGLSTAQLRAMTNVEQLDYVERFYMYWKKQGAEFKRFSDLYLVAFLPAWATNRKPDNTPFSDKIKRANGFYSRGINNLGDWRKYVENKAKQAGLSNATRGSVKKKSFWIPMLLLTTMVGTGMTIYYQQNPKEWKNLKKELSKYART